MTACSAERTLTFVLLILAEFSSSWLHFSEQDGVDNTRHGYPGAIPWMRCPRFAVDLLSSLQMHLGVACCTICCVCERSVCLGVLHERKTSVRHIFNDVEVRTTGSQCPIMFLAIYILRKGAIF